MSRLSQTKSHHGLWRKSESPTPSWGAIGTWCLLRGELVLFGYVTSEENDGTHIPVNGSILVPIQALLSELSGRCWRVCWKKLWEVWERLEEWTQWGRADGVGREKLLGVVKGFEEKEERIRGWTWSKYVICMRENINQ